LLIRGVQVTNFRNLEDTRFTFHDGLNWYLGGNGQGKTNLIESVYFGLTGKSFRTANVRDLMRDRGKTLSVGVDCERKGNRLHLEVELGASGCIRKLGGKTASLKDFLRSGGVLAFTARTKDLVEGSPEDRRRFLDQMISHLDINYLALLGKYRRSLNQLRQILLRGGDLGTYLGFKHGAVSVAKAIVARRMSFLQSIRDSAGAIHREIFNQDENLFFVYQIRNCDDFENYEKKMMDVSASELLNRRNLMGPHLDDLVIKYKNNKARHFASSGQVRGIVLSLQLAVRKACLAERGFNLVFLLDDIDAELDAERLDRLLLYLRGAGQSLLTTSKYGIIDTAKGHIFRVQAGRISPERNI
jgi:DNA replication and repair protein RecF